MTPPEHPTSRSRLSRVAGVVTRDLAVLLAIALIGAGVQAYRVQRAGWVPYVYLGSLSSGTTIRRYTKDIYLELAFTDNESLCVVRGLSDRTSIIYKPLLVERRYVHPSRRKMVCQDRECLRTLSIERVYALTTLEAPGVVFSENIPDGISLSSPNGGSLTYRPIAEPYPAEVYDAIDAYMPELSQRANARYPSLASVPYVRRHGVDPALGEEPAAAGLAMLRAVPERSYDYVRCEVGTPESPLVLTDWLDGAVFALKYVATPLAVLYLLGYWALWRGLRGLRERRRTLRGECVRCGYPLMDGFCSECGNDEREGQRTAEEITQPA